MTQPWKAYGAFELKKSGKEAWATLFKFAVHQIYGLADACGVYIICATHGQNHKIRYVGMTHQQGFIREIFSQANIKKVWTPLEKEKCSRVSIWLIAKPKIKHSGFSWSAAMKTQSGLLETLFIMHAKAAGHKLINIKKHKAADDISVEGLFGAKIKKRGPRPKSLVTLASILAFQ